MRDFWRGHRGLAILVYTILGLAFLVCAVPYLIPLGESQAEVPPQDLVGEHGRFLHIDGVRIYIEELNPESTQATVVFIHGFGGSTFSWRHNVPFFAGQGYRTIGMDMKGFGLSHKDFKSDYSHPAQADLLAAVLAELGIDRAYVVGHSMGTSVMLQFAHLYPETVLGLVSVGGAVGVDGGHAFASALMKFPPFRRTGEVFLTRYATKDRAADILESAYYQDVVTSEVVDGYYSRLITGEWAQSLLAMTRDMSENIVTFDLEDISAPALILWGEHDTWVTWNSIEQWANRIPSAEIHVIAGTGHMLMEEYPQLFNDMVLAFLESPEE
jgi:pimeloyl-ACP methyl ester carboxylesterase